MKRNLLSLSILAGLVLFTQAIFAQTGIKGVVRDSQTRETLIGANVVIQGTTTGASTGMEGDFTIEVSPGTYTLEVSYTGYDKLTIEATVTDGSYTDLGAIKLNASAIGIAGVSIIADRARERETPVAFSNVEKQDIENKLGSRDLPMVMNITPSVYATQQGGGAGDARINVRGFNQRNVAIMINGVPVNDMENGWVYWSNWDGIADATSSIQMQRGLSAVNLATPSIGGTMNVITSPAEMKAGGSAKFEVGSGNFFKTTLSGNSGLINEKFAVSVSAVRKVGEGVIDKTWTDAWAYYIGASYNLNKKHRLELYAMGAPQRHGQNLYKQNLATYDKEFAEGVDGYDTAAFGDFVQQGRLYNQNWGSVNNSYKGQQNWNGKSRDRYNDGFINERENFFHKPIVNMNWYAQWSDKVSQFTTFYYSGGKGGGTGTYGSLYRRDADGNLGDENYKFYYGPSPWSWDFNELITAQQSDADTIWIDKKPKVREPGESVGILRNSRNNQWTIGAFKTQFGVDWRTAKIEHYREVRDLLGGEYYTYTGNEFESGNQYIKKLGDKIAYYNTNTVDWLGFYAQGEYSKNAVTAYGTVGYSMVKYGFTNHFRTADTLANGDPDVNSGELVLKSNNISGFQVKGGLSYRFTEWLQIFGNIGYVSKVPIFDAVINDNTSQLIDTPENENFLSFELGANFRTLDEKLVANLNFYSTTWKNRVLTVSDYDQLEGNEGLFVLSGLDALHQGIEIDLAWQPIKYFRIDGAASFGNWKNTNDATADYKDYDSESLDSTLLVYTKDLRVGDAPQTQLAIGLTVFPVNNLWLTVTYRYYADFWADYNIPDRIDPDDREQSWKSPSYGLMDIDAGFDIPIKDRYKVQIFAHVFNVLDELYVSDARDNSQYNGYYGDNDINSHKASAAEVFMGIPRTFNAGFRFSF